MSGQFCHENEKPLNELKLDLEKIRPGPDINQKRTKTDQ